MARFTTSYGVRRLLDAVKAVATVADAHPPQAVSQRRWDGARHQTEFIDAPRAHKIAERLGCAWPYVLELAFDNHRTQDAKLGQLLGEDEADWLTRDTCASALKVVARRLDIQRLSRAAYRRESTKMRSGRSGPALIATVPTEHQILHVFDGDWNAALVAAGLEPTGMGTPMPALTGIVDVLERCYETHGTEPTLKESEVFARANRIAYPRRSRPWPS